MIDHAPTQNGASRPIEPVPRLLLTVREAAQAMAVSERTLWTLSNQGEVPVVRLGRSVRYDPRDLSAWIDSQKHP